ncbi:exodeoxyribonuclease VII large subunit [Planktotalea arctica]|uniref:exodeoxyribonuclease VII large subunit n=1 Tax=Planktotalea arctica TaxID=1481893 RepID=UPI00321BB03C
MSDLIDDPREGANEPEFTVSEISTAVKRTIEGTFDHVRIRGEVGRVVHARSGHLYFDIKDDRSVLGCTAWKGQVARLSVMPEEGMEIIATGRLTTFPNQSKYQMNVQDVAVAGEGALMAMLEKRKKKLAAEGLFDPARKQQIPFLPEVIGVITSPTGAVIRDILHRLRDRFPRKVLIWPVAVQGERCAPEVTRAIDGFNAFTAGGALPRPDLIIVARGGGSIEDLWGFNEESVARAAAASGIPLISAVGHETDTTLIDFASDLRAPTPTAAAELAVPVRAELLARLEEIESRRISAMRTALNYRGEKLRDLSRALPRVDALTAGAQQRLDLAAARLPGALTARVDRGRAALSEASGALRPSLLARTINSARERSEDRGKRLAPALERSSAAAQGDLARITKRFDTLSLAPQIDRRNDALAQLMRRFKQATEVAHSQRARKLDALDRLRLTLGYKATLERGFAVVRSAEGEVLTSTKLAKAHAVLDIEFADGTLSIGAKKTAKPSASVSKKGTQGSLF